MALIAAFFILLAWIWLLAAVVFPHVHDRFGRTNWLNRIFS
ncbi:MAG: hypothetical protein ACYCW6_09685 [Candidatus Xenobia bacterium]